MRVREGTFIVRVCLATLLLSPYIHVKKSVARQQTSLQFGLICGGDFLSLIHLHPVLHPVSVSVVMVDYVLFWDWESECC